MVRLFSDLWAVHEEGRSQTALNFRPLYTDPAQTTRLPVRINLGTRFIAIRRCDDPGQRWLNAWVEDEVGMIHNVWFRVTLTNGATLIGPDEEGDIAFWNEASVNVAGLCPAG